MSVESRIESFAFNELDPSENFSMAQEYESLGQTAAAITFYLRCAEYGITLDAEAYEPEIYSSLLKIAACLYAQNDRTFAVSNALLQAVAFNPERPDAYFLLARFYERTRQWAEGYAFAHIGKHVEQFFPSYNDPLPIETEYETDLQFDFEMAVCAHWIGRQDESKALFQWLLEEEDLPEAERAAVINNLKTYGLYEEKVVIPDPIAPVNTLEPVVTNFRKYFGPVAGAIVDVGSRDGWDADYLAKALHCGNVIAIEANPDLIDNIKNSYPYMKVLSTAVSDYIGATSFQQVVSDDVSMVGCSSIYAEKVANEPQFQGRVNDIVVPVDRLDNLLSPYPGIVDVVKIDVEGFTWEVLEGLGDRIKDVRVFHLETDVLKTQPNAKSPEEITNYMSKRGFYLADISHEWGWGIQDQVWVNKNLALNHREVWSYGTTV